MAGPLTLAVISDIHYASPAEQARGDDYELCHIASRSLRLFLRAYRHYVWLKRPLHMNGQLDQFLAGVGEPDYVVANGDYSCNTNFIGVGDEPAFQSAQTCLGKLRARFGGRLRAVFGDHELGKANFAGTAGGLRLSSWRRATGELALQPFWRLELGHYVLLGVTSTLIALPVFRPEILPEELAEWEKLSAQHLAEIRAAFQSLRPGQRLLLFCHDPTALPFLWREPAVREKISQVEQTIIGHLHSPLFLWKSRLLSGMPRLHFLGNTVRRYSAALNEARHWRPFHIRLCPSAAGIELLKDGGYLTIRLDPEAKTPAHITLHPLPR